MNVHILLVIILLNHSAFKFLRYALNYKKLDSDIGGAGDGYYWQKCPPLEGSGFGGHPWNNGGVFIIKDRTPGTQLAWLDHYGKKYNFKTGIKEDVHISFPKIGERTHLIPSTEFLSNNATVMVV